MVLDGISMSEAFRGLTAEQIEVIDALITKRAHAVNALAGITSRMRQASLNGDHHAFNLARADAEDALTLCRACELAVSVALDAFRPPAGGDNDPKETPVGQRVSARGTRP